MNWGPYMYYVLTIFGICRFVCLPLNGSHQETGKLAIDKEEKKGLG